MQKGCVQITYLRCVKQFSFELMENAKNLLETKIGSQIWAKRNLDTGIFRNGDVISEALSDKEWEAAGKEGKPAWCYYDNDSVNGKKYGRIYNWFAVNDPRGLAPEGWHVPSDPEWTVLTDNSGGEETAGKRLKSRVGWNDKGTGTNENGFTAFPGGIRDTEGEYRFIGYGIMWWSSTEDSASNAYARGLLYSSKKADRFYKCKRDGCYARCVRDA